MCGRGRAGRRWPGRAGPEVAPTALFVDFDARFAHDSAALDGLL
jgi:hypothetical protein